MAIAGKTHRVYIVTGTSTNTVVAGEISSNWTINGEIIDVSDKDSDWFQGYYGA